MQTFFFAFLLLVLNVEQKLEETVKTGFPGNNLLFLALKILRFCPEKLYKNMVSSVKC